MSLTFTAVVTAHADGPNLYRAVDALLHQTQPPDEILVFYSEIPALEMNNIVPRLPYSVKWSREPNLNDWGHDKRAKGLAAATQDYLGFFNHDDSYDRRYIEKMLAKADYLDLDYVFCAWNSIPNCQFHLGSSTSGNWIGRTSLVKEAGYTDRHYEADGTLINRVARLGVGAKIDEILYFHNVAD